MCDLPDETIGYKNFINSYGMEGTVNNSMLLLSALRVTMIEWRGINRRQTDKSSIKIPDNDVFRH